MEELDNLRKAVGLPPRPTIHINMDLWTYGRVSPPLEELVRTWRAKGSQLKAFGFLAAADGLEAVLRTWEKESEEESDRMYQDHLREEADRLEAGIDDSPLPDLCFSCGGVLYQCECGKKAG